MGMDGITIGFIAETLIAALSMSFQLQRITRKKNPAIKRGCFWLLLVGFWLDFLNLWSLVLSQHHFLTISEFTGKFDHITFLAKAAVVKLYAILFSLRHTAPPSCQIHNQISPECRLLTPHQTPAANSTQGEE